jgi:hypothetical protein
MSDIALNYKDIEGANRVVAAISELVKNQNIAKKGC